MAVVRCWQCGYVGRVKTIEEAQRLARLHMGTVGCIMVFGYTDAKYREALGLDEMNAEKDSCEPFCTQCNQYKCVCPKED